MEALVRSVYPRFRSHPFRGMGRLRPFLPTPTSGTRVASLPGGLSLRLDLREAHQRDLLFGLYDYAELHLLRRALREGGDFIDVGAHIGFYTVAAALSLRHTKGRVVALEPHPVARQQLRANLELNGVQADVMPQAAGEAIGDGLLHVPATEDASWSSLDRRRLPDESQAIQVQLTTVDRVTESSSLRPVLLKIDVEGYEVQVLRGAQATAAKDLPIIICEVGEDTATDVAATLGKLGYEPYRPVRRRFESGLGTVVGIFNVVFVPPHRQAIINT